MNKQRSLHDARHFTGLLGSGGKRVSVSFETRLDKTGKVVLQLKELPFDKTTRFIYDEWHRENHFAYYDLTGTSDDGMTFETDCLFFNSIGPNSSSNRGSYFVFNAHCEMAKFRYRAHDVAEKPHLMYWLKGFWSLPQLRTLCPIGGLVMGGNDSAATTDELSGYLAIRSDDLPADMCVWRAEAKKLLDHVYAIMAFASGTDLKAPVQQFTHGCDIETEVVSTSDHDKEVIPTFHGLERQNIFETAVSHFFNPSIRAENIWMAVEWFTMPATYREMRLVNSMTALENLVNSNARDIMFLLEGKPFDRLAKRIRAEIKQFIQEEGLSDNDLLKELADQLRAMRRHALKEKLRLLLQRWSVPMDGVDDGMIKDAFDARDNIVHEGRYYIPGQEREQKELWVHVTVIREIVTRMIFTILGFRGRYVSHLGGYHTAVFPPEPKAS